MVDARSKSSFFTNVTKAAAKALISLKNKQYINDLSGYLLDENVNVRQKEAIITAFTDSKMLVPNIFTIYDKNVQLQEVLQKNGLSINPKIFENKMFAEVNNYLKFFRSNPGDYDNQIDALQRYNVDGFADDNMFTNLKGIADIYAIQKYLHAVLSRFQDHLIKRRRRIPLPSRSYRRIPLPARSRGYHPRRKSQASRKSLPSPS